LTVQRLLRTSFSNFPRDTFCKESFAVSAEGNPLPILRLRAWRFSQLPKRKRGFRLSQAADKALTTYSQKWNCSPTETLERLLLRWRYLDDVGFSEFQETLDEEISCSNRIRNKGLFYCLHGVPQNVKLDRRLIETLDICRVCRRRKLGLTEASKIEVQVAGQGEEEQKRDNGITSVPSPFSRSSPPDPIQRKPAVQGLETFSCPRYHNRSYCLASVCDLRKQCREVGRIEK
jgi:hypothetical protein